MFSGRIGRLGFILGAVYLFAPFVIVMVLYAFGAFISALSSPNGATPLLAAMNNVVFVIAVAWILLILPVQFGLMIRRWHDIDQTGWLTLLSFVPFIGLIASVLQVFMEGTQGPNKYGDPQTRHDFKTVLFGSNSPAPAQPAPPPAPPSDPPTA